MGATTLTALERRWETEAAIFIVILAVVLMGFVAYWAAHARSRALVGDLHLTASNLHPLLGEVVSVALTIRPPGDPTLNELSLTLRAYEWIRWTETRTSTDSKGRSSTRTVTRTKTEVLYTKTWSQKVGRKVRPLERFTVEGSIRIPRDAPPSFTEAPNNKIEWEIVGDVDIAGLPDLRETGALKVQPIIKAED